MYLGEMVLFLWSTIPNFLKLAQNMRKASVEMSVATPTTAECIAEPYCSLRVLVSVS